MKMSEYVRRYTIGKKSNFRRVSMELTEFWEEIRAGRWHFALEEFGDVCHMFQIWLYYHLHLDLPLWLWCGRKFIRRQQVWQKMHDMLGMRCWANLGANYKRDSKVTRYFARFGISPERALAARATVLALSQK